MQITLFLMMGDLVEPFIDSDGSVYLNEASGQVFIGISQKKKYLLEPLIHIYGGRVDIYSSY
jgi:hypothetical protein